MHVAGQQLGHPGRNIDCRSTRPGSLAERHRSSHSRAGTGLARQRCSSHCMARQFDNLA